MSRGGPDDDEADGLGHLTIDLDALGENWRRLAGRAAPAECAAAVKADAYGLGIEAVAPALHRAGCRTFFVAHASEGRRVRRAIHALAGSVSGGEARVFVLNGFHPDAAPLARYLAHDLSAVIGSGAELAAWEAALTEAGSPDAARCAIHVDTGMNRLGFPPGEAMSLDAARLAAAHATLLLSHMVAAERPADAINAHQIAAFAALRQGPLGALPASLANSSGILLPGCPAHDLVRPGYALYGGNPVPGRPNPMRPVVSLRVRILQRRDVPAGVTVGYNGRWTASRPSRLVTLALGYADGLPMGASGLGVAGAPVFVGGHPCPVVGRISMDLTIADASDVPEPVLAGAVEAEVLGPHVGVDDFARQAGTIGYDVLTGLGHRYRRHYLGDGTGIAPVPPSPDRMADPA